MSISEEEKERIFYPNPEPDEQDYGVPDRAPDSGTGYDSLRDSSGRVHLFDDSGVEIDLEHVPDYEDPFQAVDDGLSPAQRQVMGEWEQYYRGKQAEEEPEETPEPSYISEIRNVKIQCDGCGKVESLETANCLGGAKDSDTEEIYAVFGCGCGHTENIPAEDLPPRYIERAAMDENAIEQIIRDIEWREKIGL